VEIFTLFVYFLLSWRYYYWYNWWADRSFLVWQGEIRSLPISCVANDWWAAFFLDSLQAHQSLTILKFIAL